MSRFFLLFVSENPRKKAVGGSIPINYYRLSNEHLFPDMPQDEDALEGEEGLTRFTDGCQKLKKYE